MLLTQVEVKPATGAKKTTEIGSLFASSSLSRSFLDPRGFNFLRLTFFCTSASHASRKQGRRFLEIGYLQA